MGICQCLVDQLLIIDRLVTHKSRYFAQPCSKLVNYFKVILFPEVVRLCLTKDGKNINLIAEQLALYNH